MSETPQDDPWARVRALRPNPYSHEHYYVASEADAARAAEATQRQQELIDLRANYAQSMRLSNDTLADTLARLAAVEAERDHLKNQIIDLGARVAIAEEERTDAATLRAERHRLKAALAQITALDFEKVNGRHNFYSGAAMFVKAWLLAYAALSGEGTAKP